MKKGNFTSNSTQNGTLVGATTERMKEQTNHIEDKHAVAGKKVKLVCSTTVPIKLMKLPTATDDSDVYIIKPALSTNSRRSTSAASFITVPILNRKSKDNGKSHTNIDCSDDLNEETVKGIENCRSQAVSKCKQNGYVIMAYKKGAEKKEDAISSVGKRIHESSTCLASATSSSTVSSSKSTEPQGLIHDISKPIVHSQATIMSRSHDLPVTSDRIKRNKDYRQNTAMGVKIVPHAQQNNRAPTQKTMSLAVSSASKVNQPCDMKTGYVTSQKRMEGSRQEQREDIESNHDAVDGNCASDMLLMNGTANEEQTMSKSEDRKQMSSTVSDLITEKSAGVTTISTDDLAKLLKQYNLTLKAVPFDCREDEIERSRSLGKEVKSIKNNRKGGQVYITSVKNASKFRTAFGTSDLTKTNILEEPGRSSTLSLLDYDKTEGKSGSERPLRVQVRLLREGNISSSSTVSKTTPQGTFSNWRIDCKKSSTFCAKKETRSRSKRTRETGKTRRASTQGASRKPTIVKIPSDTKRPEEYGFRSLSYKNFQSFNENNNIKVQDVVYCQHRTTPLYHAFLDLEARDQAARETVRSLENTQHINSDPSMAKTRTCELCPLFPTMRDLVVDNLVDADVDDATQADPVLTSAVAFPCQDTEYDYVGGDLESTYFPLSNTCAETSVLSNDGNKLLNQNHVQFSEDQSAIENSEKDSTEEEQVPTSNASNTFKILDNSYSSKNHSTLSHEYYGFPSNPAEEKLDSISTKISLPSVNEFQSTSDNAKTNEDNLICQSSANNYFCTQDGNRETRFAKPSLHLERNTRKTLSYRGDSESKKGCGEVAIHQNGNYRTSITHGQENSRYLQAFNRDCYAKRRRASSASDDCSCKRVIENDAVLKQRLRDAEKKSSDPHTEQRSSATDSVDYFKFTSPRNWNSKQVAAWFRDTAEKYHKDKRISQRSKNGVLKTTRKRKLTANNNHSTEYEKLVPSTVNSLSGQTLCQFTVDDLVDIGLDRDFALYATEVVHTTDDNCEDINSTARDNTMSNHNSYDIQSSLQSTPITSAEQLEESVNFDDLLGSDSIIGSLELLDVFESSTSFLKSLGQDYIVTRTSLPQPSTPSVSMHFHQPLPDFSTAHYHHHMQQNGLTNCTESGIMSTLNLYRNDMNLSLPYKSPYQYDTRMGFDRVVKQEENGIDSNQNFFENYQNIPTSVKCETSDQTFQYLQASSNTTQRTISPSTFYNVPNTSRGVIHNYHPSVSDQSYSSTSNKPKWEGMYSKPASTGYTSHRDSSMSDTDSGIHSPESTPNKNHCATCTLSNQANACGTVDGKNAGIIVQEQNKYTPMCPISEEGMICNEGVWSTAMGADMLTEQTSYVTPQDSNNEVFAFTKTGTDNIQCCEKKSDTNPMLEDLWERGSTSSTVSTLSLESEPKLLNMDDYKTYIATKPTNSDMAQQSSQSYHCNLQQTVDQVRKVSPTVRTLTGNVVFVPARENSTDNSIQIPLTKAIVETKQKRTKAVTNGQITTVYPAFMANIRRTNSLPSSPGDKSKPKASAVSQNKPLSADGSPKNHDVSPGQQLTVKTEFQSNDGLEPLYDDPFEGKMRRTPAGKSIHLWEFIRDTLLNPLYCPRLIKWEDRNSGIFRFVQSDIVAGMWGEKKNNPKMTYEKLSRAMRYYYNRGILERVDGRRLVYKFGKNAHGWQLTTADTHTDVKTTGTLKKEKSTNRRVSTFQTVKSPKLSVTSSKRSSKYQISVSHSCGDEKNYIPSRKRRRLSEPEVTKDISLVSTDQKSAGTQTSPSPSTEAANKVRVKKADESMEFGSDSDRRQSSSCDDVTECVVFVASTEPITTTQPKQCESNDKREHAVESEECWSPVSSPDRNSKLPSADVLLGKHYKIATVAI